MPESLYKLLEGQLAFMNNYYEVVAVSSGGPILGMVGQTQGVRVHAVEMSRKITPFNDLGALLRLWLFFLKEKPFIVHTHTPKAGTLGIMAAWMAGVPNRLHTVAGLPLLKVTGPKRKLLDLVETLTYRLATRIYPNSEGLKKIIIQNGYTREKNLKVLGNGSSNGIDTDWFAPGQVPEETVTHLKKQLELEDHCFVLCFIGRLVKDKGINELVAAFVKLYNNNSNLRLILVGSFEPDLDPLLPSTLRAIREHPGIVFTGTQHDVRPYLKVCDVFVFPSHREGFPNVVMQAGAMGKPCIVTDINGCNEIITDRVNGLIIPVKSSQAIIEAVDLLAGQPELRINMKNAARSMIVERFGRSRMWQTILSEYQALERETMGEN